jgi:hypothetical protein
MRSANVPQTVSIGHATYHKLRKLYILSNPLAHFLDVPLRYCFRARNGRTLAQLVIVVVELIFDLIVVIVASTTLAAAHHRLRIVGAGVLDEKRGGGRGYGA